jgi:hypothetical protein
MRSRFRGAITSIACRHEIEGTDAARHGAKFRRRCRIFYSPLTLPMTIYAATKTQKAYVLMIGMSVNTPTIAAKSSTMDAIVAGLNAFTSLG